MKKRVAPFSALIPIDADSSVLHLLLQIGSTGPDRLSTPGPFMPQHWGNANVLDSLGLHL